MQFLIHGFSLHLSFLFFPSVSFLPPQTLMIQPLMRSERETAESLKSRLLAEAEETRKKTKRNAFTGIHKYLDLVRYKDIFACLVANAGSEGEQVISFPPITNR